MRFYLLLFLFTFTSAQKMSSYTGLPPDVDVVELDNSVLMIVPLRKGAYDVKYSLTNLVIFFNDNIYINYKIPQFIDIEKVESVTLDDKELCVVLPKRKVDENGIPILVDHVEQVKLLIDIRQGRIMRPELQLLASPF